MLKSKHISGFWLTHVDQKNQWRFNYFNFFPNMDSTHTFSSSLQQSNKNDKAEITGKKWTN